MSQVRTQLLREMKLSAIWRLRTRDAQGAALPAAGDQALLAEQAAGAQQAASQPGIGVEVRTPPPVSPSEPSVRGETVLSERAARIAKLEWGALEADIRACTACHLCERRKQAVPGYGDRQAKWMFVGEGPGAEEDRQGLPFVGAAGKLLDAMLASIGLNRDEQVYIANTVKCRPPMNRTPAAEEIAACRPYLERQIALIRPKVLIALGRPAAQTLLDTEVRIGAARGKTFHYADIPVVVTYHPAYLLRNQHDKRKVWADLCFARSLVEEEVGRA